MDVMKVRGDAAMDDLREIVASLREHATSMRNRRPWIFAVRHIENAMRRR